MGLYTQVINRYGLDLHLRTASALESGRTYTIANVDTRTIITVGEDSFGKASRDDEVMVFSHVNSTLVTSYKSNTLDSQKVSTAP